jgi:capping protein beta
VADHRFVKAGSWDSIHVLEASSVDGKVFTYKLTTTVMLSMAVDNAEVGDTNLSGSVTRQVNVNHAQE